MYYTDALLQHPLLNYSDIWHFNMRQFLPPPPHSLCVSLNRINLTSTLWPCLSQDQVVYFTCLINFISVWIPSSDAFDFFFFPSVIFMHLITFFLKSLLSFIIRYLYLAKSIWINGLKIFFHVCLLLAHGFNFCWNYFNF